MAILFDLDGTLFDTAKDMYIALQQLKQNLTHNNKVKVSDLKFDIFRNTISAGSDVLLKLMMPELDKTSAEFTDIKNIFLKNYMATNFINTDFFPGMIELIKYIESKNIPWGIVTNRLIKFTKLLEKKILDNTKCGCIVSGDTTKNPKPHPDPIYYACKQLNVNPEDCLYIGDDERDIIAGNSAGTETVTVLYGYITDKEKAKKWPANYIAQDTEDLFRIVKKWIQQKN